MDFMKYELFLREVLNLKVHGFDALVDAGYIENLKDNDIGEIKAIFALAVYIELSKKQKIDFDQNSGKVVEDIVKSKTKDELLKIVDDFMDCRDKN